MRRTRRDGNHGQLQSVFLQMGCTVLDHSATGIPGEPDVTVGCIGVNHLVEFKDPTTRYGQAGLNPNQQAFSRDWRGGPVFAVSSRDEVIALVTNWRRAA